MDRWNLLVILLFFVYFLSFITGTPALRIGLTPDEAEELRQMNDSDMLFLEGAGEPAGSQTDHAGAEALREQRLPGSHGEYDGALPGTELAPADDALSETEGSAGADPRAMRRAELEATRSRVTMGWSPGLVERVLTERRMLNVFRDPLLESDSRPDELLRQMARSFTTESFQLGVNVFWCALILLCLVAYWKRHWFFHPMSTIVVIASVLMLSFDLMTASRSAVALYDNKSTHVLQALLNVSLIVLGVGLMLQKLLPPYGRLVMHETQFMGHLRREPLSSGTRRRRRIIAPFMEIGAIIVAGLFVANALLFPIYKLQLSFPGLFVGLLVAGFLLLAAFYVRAYLRVARSQSATGTPVSVLSAVAFLGYRMLGNTLFLVAVISLVCVMFGIIIVFTIYNINVLQDFQLLPRPDSL